MDDMFIVESVDCMIFLDIGCFCGIVIVIFVSANIANEVLRWYDIEWDGMVFVVKLYELKIFEVFKFKFNVGKVEG